jgi:hypothetical protein
MIPGDKRYSSRTVTTAGEAEKLLPAVQSNYEPHDAVNPDLQI